MVKMLRGVFGLPIDGIVKAMDKNSGPFKASAEQEARLVRLGLAVYVDEHAAEVENEDMEDNAPIGFDETPPDDFVDDTAEDAAEVEEEIVDLATLSAKELRELGKEYGLSFKANASKVSMIEAIMAAQAELDESAEDAPAFDAAEAVL